FLWQPGRRVDKAIACPPFYSSMLEEGKTVYYISHLFELPGTTDALLASDCLRGLNVVAVTEGIDGIEVATVTAEAAALDTSLASDTVALETCTPVATGIGSILGGAK